jgi:hypothetical protein
LFSDSCFVIANKPETVIASKREAIQLESQEEAQCRHGTSKPIISWIASLTLAMTSKRGALTQIGACYTPLNLRNKTCGFFV